MPFISDETLSETNDLYLQKNSKKQNSE